MRNTLQVAAQKNAVKSFADDESTERSFGGLFLRVAVKRRVGGDARARSSWSRVCGASTAATPPRRMMPSRATINYGLRCVLSVHLFAGGMLIATGCRLLVAPPELQQMAQAAAHEFDFIVPGDYRLSGTSVFLLAGAAKISAVVAFWFLPAALDVVATLGLVLLFAAVTHVHFLTAQPLVPPAVMAMLALAKLLTTPTQRPRKAAKGLN